MKNIFLLTGKDFRRKWRNPVVIIGFLLIPFVFTLIFASIFGASEDEEALPRISVITVDKDKSLLSRFFLSSLSQGELKKLLSLQEAEEAKGRKLLDKGKASALLIIPENFGDHLWEGREVEILLLKNPAEQYLPQIVQEICDTASLLFSSLFSVFSDELDTIKGFVDDNQFSDENVSMISIKFKSKFESISKYVFPPVISLTEKTRAEEEKEEASALTISSYILPAIAVMFLLFICNVVFEDILREKESGTLMRMTVSPLKLSEFIWSKIVTSAAIGMICTLVLIVLGRFIFSIQWGHPLLVLAVVFCLNIVMAGFIAFLYSFVRTERQAGAVLSSVILVMALLGGSMIPVDNFPPLVQTFSKFTLNYWGILAFHKTMLQDPIREIFPILLSMVVVGLLLSLLGSYFLEKSLRKGLLK